MNKISKELINSADKSNKDFMSKLIPNVDPSTILGVKVPLIREIVKNNNKDAISFINELPHKYYEENLAHVIILSKLKNYDESIKCVHDFSKYLNCWPLTDTLHPASFKNNLDKVIKEIDKLINSKKEYLIRLGIDWLMTFYLDDEFKNEHLEKVINIKSDLYYVNMMRAWYFATALSKQYDATIKVIKERKLDSWTHNKAIQKAIESNRIDDKTKEYLRTLKY